MVKQTARAVYFKVGLPVLRALPFPSTVFGPVTTRHASVPSWIEDSQKKARASSVHSLVRHGEAQAVENEAPVAVFPRVPDNVVRSCLHQAPELYVACLQRARIATEWFEVISPDDGIFEDLFYPNGITGVRSVRSLVVPRLPRLQVRHGTFATILTKGGNNYYHWVNDSLTRLWLLEQGQPGDYTLIVPATLLSFHRQSLALLGYAEERLAPFGNEHWQVDQLLVPSLTNAASQSNPDACRWLARRLLAAVEHEAARWPRKIYVSRRHASKRRLSNEAELEHVLARRGFEAVCTEHMSFAEQAALFREADVVVAPHGAGLTNILFMQEGRLVVELLPYRRAKTCYYSLASAMRLRYACVTDAPEQPEDEVQDYQPDADFAVATERVDKALDALGV